MSRPRVLIVDDDEQICRVAARALEEIAICDAAHDVGQATRALQRAAYDLVLVDVGLPGPSGMTLLDELRRYWPQTGALMLSGTTDLSVANDALARGALGYVVKPFRVRDLRIQVSAALSGARRSADATRASTRARIVAELNERLDTDDATIVCLVVDLEHIPVLNASYGVAAIDQLCACVEERLRDFDTDVEVLGPLGPTTLAASLRLHPARAASQTARELHRALSPSALIEGTWIPISARLGVSVAVIRCGCRLGPEPRRRRRGRRP